MCHLEAADAAPLCVLKIPNAAPACAPTSALLRLALHQAHATHGVEINLKFLPSSV